MPPRPPRVRATLSKRRLPFTTGSTARTATAMQVAPNGDDLLRALGLDDDINAGTAATLAAPAAGTDVAMAPNGYGFDEPDEIPQPVRTVVAAVDTGKSHTRQTTEGLETSSMVEDTGLLRPRTSPRAQLSARARASWSRRRRSSLRRSITGSFNLHGCSTVVLIRFTCPAITVGTVILRALHRHNLNLNIWNLLLRSTVAFTLCILYRDLLLT